MRNPDTRVSPIFLAILIVALSGAVAAAQYGHPLKGTWSGDWGPNKETRNRVLLELHWDGKAITGTINPGPRAVPLQRASLDPATWGVRFEADGYVIEGKIENLGSYRRVLTGTWTQAGQRGDFRLTRN